MTPSHASAAKSLCGFAVADAAALAAHYGSVSAVTFAAVLTFLEVRGGAYEGFVPALVAVLEVPAIVIGLLIARLKLAAPPGVGVKRDGAGSQSKQESDATKPESPFEPFDAEPTTFTYFLRQ